MRAEMIGITKAVKDSDVANLSDDDQDTFIAEVLKSCAADLEKFTKGARPLSDFIATVTGPHDDPIQGMIHVHTIAAQFDVDTLDHDSEAYGVHVLKAPGATEGNANTTGVDRG